MSQVQPPPADLAGAMPDPARPLPEGERAAARAGRTGVPERRRRAAICMMLVGVEGWSGVPGWAPLERGSIWRRGSSWAGRRAPVREKLARSAAELEVVRMGGREANALLALGDVVVGLAAGWWGDAVGTSREGPREECSGWGARDGSKELVVVL